MTIENKEQSIIAEYELKMLLLKLRLSFLAVILATLGIAANIKNFFQQYRRLDQYHQSIVYLR